MPGSVEASPQTPRRVGEGKVPNEGISRREDRSVHRQKTNQYEVHERGVVTWQMEGYKAHLSTS